MSERLKTMSAPLAVCGKRVRDQRGGLLGFCTKMGGHAGGCTHVVSVLPER